MNFETTHSIETDNITQGSTIVGLNQREKTRMSTFRQDAYKKSLKVTNSSVALPNVEKQTQQHLLGPHGSTLQLLANNESAIFQHKGPSLITPIGGSTRIEGGEVSTQIEEVFDIGNELLTIQDSNIAASNQNMQSYDVSVRNKVKSTMAAPYSQYHRNSSTVQKQHLKGDFNAMSNILNVDVKKQLGKNSSSLIDPLRYEKNNFQTVLNQSTRNLPTYNVLGGGDYASVNILPVIGSEMSIDQGANRFQHKIPTSTTNSKMELTRKDIQNYLVNGSISKEFIHSSKKELQKFIKNQTRASGRGEQMLGYKEFGNLNKNGLYETNQSTGSTLSGLMRTQGADSTSIPIKAQTIVKRGDESPDGGLGLSNILTPSKQQSSLNRKLIGSSTIHVGQASTSRRKKAIRGGSQAERQRMENLDEGRVFHDDIELEKKFKGDTGKVTNKVMETWINETLTDAYHLEIPGVLVKPEHKLPIYRYGIDRQTLLQAGVSDAEVDRIYRSLFVYSVGFFELLKKILKSTGKSYSIITCIWKVFQVLLEYCCKTDYRILISEITDKYNHEMNEVEKKFKEKIQKYLDDEKVLKQNMETMRDYNEVLEKERQIEKNLRLKLEEEYMQNTRNHEEEVKLRLKFEGKFNTMNDEHRELEIRHNRTLKEKYATEVKLDQAESEASTSSKQLIELQQVNVQQSTLIDELTEYKKVAEKELKKKNQMILNADQKRNQAYEDFELERYRTRDQAIEYDDLKTKLDVVASQNDYLMGVIDSTKVEKEEIELARIKIKGQYQKIKAEFELRVHDIEKLEAQLENRDKKANEYFKELEPLRERAKELREKNDEFRDSNLELKSSNRQLSNDNLQFSKENKINQAQVSEINADRHRLLLEAAEKKEEVKNLWHARDIATETIEEKQNQIKKLDHHITTLKMNFLNKEQALNDEIAKKRTTIKEQENELEYRKTQADNYVKSIDTIQQRFTSSETKGAEMDEEISSLVDTKLRLTTDKEDLETKLNYATAESYKLKVKVDNAQDAQNDAVLEMNKHMEISATLQNTVQSMRREMKEQLKSVEEQNQAVYLTLVQSNERDMMVAEETVSRFTKMTEEHREAMEEKYANREMLEKFKTIHITIGSIEQQRDEAYGDLEKLRKQVKHLQHEVKKLQEDHVLSLRAKEVDHNTEVNELEQKIQEERIALANFKSKTMKAQREEKLKILELNKHIKALEKNGGGPASKRSSVGSKLSSKKGSKAGIAPVTPAFVMPEQADKSVQTTFDTQSINSKNYLYHKQESRRMKKHLFGNKSSKDIAQRELLGIAENKLMSDKESSIEIENSISNHFTQSREKIESDNTFRNQISESEEDETESGALQGTSNKPTMPQSNDGRGSSSRINLQDKAKRNEAYKEWLIEEERLILEKLEKKASQNIATDPKQLVKWREEIRIPAMFLDLKLTDKDNREVVQKIQELAEQYRDRVIRRIDEGSQYSSDFEDIEKSEYYSSDGNANGYELQERANILIQRGSTIRKPKIQAQPLEKAAGQAQPLEQATGYFFNDPVQIEGQSLEPLKANDYAASPTVEDLDPTYLGVKPDKQSELRTSAVDRVVEHVRIQNERKKAYEQQLEKDAADGENGDDIIYQHMLDNEMPTTSYMIMKNKDGKDVYKRREVKIQRVQKQRKDGYEQAKRRALSARASKQLEKDDGQHEVIQKRYTNIFANFAKNFESTLATLVRSTKQYGLNQAKARQKMGKNGLVENIRGRGIHHFLVKEMKDTPAWQIHLAKLKKELADEENKWQHREEEQQEMVRLRIEIKQMEEMHEREVSNERRKNTVIIREDLMIKEQEEKFEDERRKWHEMQTTKPTDQSIAVTPKNMNNMLITTDQSPLANNQEKSQQPTDMEQYSMWSEDGPRHQMSQRDAQNPQGEEELIDLEGGELRLIFESSQAQRQAQGNSSLLDPELAELTRGGVAAINRQSNQQRTQIVNNIHEQQMNAEVRAQEKDMVLAQRGMLAQQKSQEEKKKKSNSKLGPSTIRTLIRAADSRRQ